MRLSSARRLVTVVSLLALGPSVSGALEVQNADTAYLMELPGTRVTVRYEGGSLDRSANLQRRFEWMLDAVSRWSRTAVGLQLIVIGRDDWAAVAGQTVPYGVPTVRADGAVVIPAHGGPDTIALWHQNLGLSLPRVEGMPLVGTSEEVASLGITDLMAELEVAGVMLKQAGIHGATPQVEGLLTMATAWDAWSRFESDRLPEIERILSELASNPDAASPPYARFSLAARTLPAARQMVEASGHRPMRRLAKLAQRAGGTVTACGVLNEFDGLRTWQRAHSDPALACRGKERGTRSE